MAKGARRKTKWVSLSLANTTTSVATGSDSEQQPHQQSHHHHHGGHRQKTLNGAASTTTKYSSSGKEVGDASEEHHSNEPLDTPGAGNRTDTSGSGSGSDSGPNGYASSWSERRPGAGPYQRRRPPPYHHTRSSWTAAGGTGSLTNGRGTYSGGNRTAGYYNGGGGYYGSTGRRSYYDTHTRRPVNASGTNKTTSGEGEGEGGGGVGGGGGGATTINDDEYTRITTPRQDVLFKKGYLSRPKPTATAATTATATASTSNENTASSSLAGTTSDGSDHGGNASISTTASITSEFGGSFAADGSALFPDYPYPLLPCGYFTENGVLVMNGFAVDNNGYSYFNGGQTYIYPPHFSNCQPGQQEQPPPSPADPTDSMPPYPAANDETTNATNPEGQPAPDGGESPMAVVAEPAVVVLDRCRQDVGAGGDGVGGNPSAGAEDDGPCEAEGQSAAIAVDCSTSSPDEASASAVVDAAGDVEEIPLVMPTAPVPDYENGFYQFTDGYDFAQFWSSMCYQNWLMEQYPLYDDAGAPVYCTGGEYALPNGGDVYTHQTGFKRRKKRFRTFEEIAGENGAAHVLGDVSSAIVHEGNHPAVGDVAASVLPATDGAQAPPQEYRLNVDVQEFQPSATGAPSQTPPNGDQATPVAGAAAHNDQNLSPRVTKKPPPAVKLASKFSCKSSPAPPVSGVRPPAAAISHKIRKKDLIELTLAFAEQNIDLTRSKALASGRPSLDSELDCWTTIDRNGRKKRQEKLVDAVKEKPVHPANGDQRGGVAVEKVATVPSDATSQPTVISTPPSASSSSSSSSTTMDNANAPQDTSSKRQDQQITKQSKKKTKPNKRQQHRKSAGGFHKQHKQEGFQLIEPEFPSVASVGRQRARGGCDNVANDDDDYQLDVTNDSQEESHEKVVEQVEQHQIEAQVEEQSVAVVVDEVVRRKEAKEESETVAATLSGAYEEQRKEADCVEQQQEQEQVPPAEELNCDKAQGLVLATPSPPLSCAMAVVEEPIIVNKTENVMHQRRQEEREPAHIAQPVGTEAVEHRSASEVSVVVVDAGPQKKKPIVEGPVSEENEKPDGARQQQPADGGVLTSAARQLGFGERPEQEEDDEDEEQEEQEEEDESRGKRGSVSGSVGYTESIDSGLQSPVSPCGGGVASPEASSMVSSIESDETTPLDPAAAQSEAPLSQIVAKWLLRKLEVHEPEEVFVLPSDPLLIERLERFQLLQRRGGRRPRQGAFSASDDSEDDLGDSDSDSDYMSDGPGRLERAADDDDTPSEAGPLSPSATDRTAPEHAGEHDEAAPAKPPVLCPSDSRSINSTAGAPRRAAAAASASASGSDAKRCVIM